MLKNLLINGKKVTVPVPLGNLGQALSWIEDTFTQGGRALTRIILNRQEMGLEEVASQHLGARELNAEDRLEIQLETAVELTLQVLDAVRNLASMIETCIKQVAVQCWQNGQAASGSELPALIDDLQMILELIDHINELTREHQAEFSDMMGIRYQLGKAFDSLSMAKASGDWKACSRILLNVLEAKVTDLVNEAVRCQSFLFSIRHKAAQHRSQDQFKHGKTAD